MYPSSLLLRATFAFLWLTGVVFVGQTMGYEAEAAGPSKSCRRFCGRFVLSSHHDEANYSTPHSINIRGIIALGLL